MAQSDALLTAIEAVHAAGVDPDAWPSALSTMAALFGSNAATVESYDVRNGALLVLHAHGIPPAEQLDYFEHYAAINPRRAFGMRAVALEILWDYRILDEFEMDRDPYYCELLPRTGFRYFMSGEILRSSREVAITSIQRTAAQGHVQDTEIAMMHRFLPHLRQALDVARRLGAETDANASLRHAVDHLGEGVALVDAAGLVLHANAALQEMARGDNGFRVGRSALEFTSARAGESLARALASIAAVAEPSAAPLEFAVERGNGLPPLIVAVRPVRVSERRSDAGPRPMAMVFVHDPLRAAPASAELLQSVFGLTPAEADLARALHAGTSPARHARDRAVSVNTVYTHLRRLKEKTGTTRLAELTNLIDKLSPPLR